MGVGVGFNAGPFYVGVGSSWRSLGQGMGAIVVLSIGTLFIAIPLVIFTIIVVWPYHLGRYFADVVDASPTAQTATAWVFEGFYILVLLIIAGALLNRHGKRLEATQLRERTTTRVSSLRQESALLHAEIANLDAAATVVSHFAGIMKSAPRGLARAQIEDLAEIEAHGFEMPAAERLLGVLPSGLTKPRVAERNGPKVQTTIARGQCVVTDKHIRFVSNDLTESWRVSAITGVIREGHRILIPVSTRRTVYGIDASVDDPTGSAGELLLALISWARALPAAPTEQVAHLERLSAGYQSRSDYLLGELAPVEDELAAARRDLRLLPT